MLCNVYFGYVSMPMANLKYFVPIAKREDESGLAATVCLSSERRE